MRVRTVLGVVLASVLALAGRAAHAYEGEGILREVPDAGAVAPVLTRPPELLKFVEATYPPDALATGISAEVALLVDIDATGKVSAAEIERSGGADFDAAAKEALLRFEFSPAEVDTKPAPVRIEYVYHFEPKPQLPPVSPPEPTAAAAIEKPVNLRGRVLERGTRDPIASATVYLPDLGLAAETDGEGHFELRGVPLGAVKVEVSEPGHRKFATTEQVKEGQVTELTLYALKKLEGGFETTVVGQREKKEVSRHSLEKGELGTVPGTFGDPLRVLQNMPGVGRPPLVSGALLVRGAQPQDSQVLIDGVPIPLLYHFAGGPSVVSPSYIDRIDFFPGAYGAKYGRAIAGIVDVETGGPEPKRLHGLANVDLLNAGFYVESPISQERNWGTLSLAARRSYIDALLPPIMSALTPPGQASIVAAPYYWDYQGRYQVTLDRNKLELSAFGSNDLLTLSQTGSLESQAFSLNTQQGFHRFRAKWSRPTDSGWTFSLAPTAGFTQNNFSLGDSLKVGANSTDLNVRGAARTDISKALSFEAGVDINSNWFDNRFETPGLATPAEANPPPNVRDQKLTLASYAGYAEAVWAPLEAWKVIPGLRFEEYRLPKGYAASLEPRFATRYSLSDSASLKAAWGIYRQAPQSRELDPTSGNPDLGLAMSQQTAAGAEMKLPLRLMLDVQGFYNWRSQLVVNSSAIVERDGQQAPERLKNGGTGHAYGVEVLLKQDLTERSYGWIAYTLSRSEQYDETSGGYVPVSFDQTHILTVVGSYKLDAGWELGLRFRVTSGRPETPILGSTFNADTGSYSALNGAPGSARGAVFNQLDLRAEKLWTFDQWRLSAYLDVQNVYNAPNPEQVLWDYRYRDSASLRGLPILPTLGVKGEI